MSLPERRWKAEWAPAAREDWITSRGSLELMQEVLLNELTHGEAVTREDVVSLMGPPDMEGDSYLEYLTDCCRLALEMKMCGSFSTVQCTKVLDIGSITPDWDSLGVCRPRDPWTGGAFAGVHAAILRNDREKFDELLQSGADVFEPQFGRATIHLASQQPCSYFIERLIDLGVSIEAPDYSGQTPLHYACESGSRNVFWLLNRGACVHARNWAGETPLYRACIPGNPEANIGHLASQKADVNSLDLFDRSALHFAVARSKPGSVKKLLSLRAHVHQRDSAGRTPLHLAFGYSASAISELLLRSGAEVNCLDDLGYTPLQYAVFNSLQHTETLLSHRADPNIAGRDGVTAIQRLDREARGACIDLLRRYGAKD